MIETVLDQNGNRVHKFYRSASPFSNFFEVEFQFQGRIVSCSEIPYQAMKFVQTDPGYAVQIMEVRSAFESKQLGHSEEHPRHPLWEKVVYHDPILNEDLLMKDLAMYEILYAKFSLSPLKRLLLSTEDIILFEDSPTDLYWGGNRVNGVEGKNMLGKLLMRLRWQFREEEIQKLITENMLKMKRIEPKATNVLNDQLHSQIPVQKVRVLALRRPKPEYLQRGAVINTTSGSAEVWSKGLSPFFVGPITLTDGRKAHNLENAWQYSKVYKQHIGSDGFPNQEWWRWSESGFNNPSAVRFPMGRGAIPEYSLWFNPETKQYERLGYIDARKKLYAPLYAEAVEKTEAFQNLVHLYQAYIQRRLPLSLIDFDGWDHLGQGYKLEEVINLAKPKMGHAFVLAGLLEENWFWLK